MSINEQLLKVYKTWEAEVLKPYIVERTDAGYYNADNKTGKWNKKYEGSQISCPFYMGLTDDYINSDKKRVMIVGQEARGYGIYTRDRDKKGYEAQSSQEWSNTYLSRQLCLQDNNGDLKYNASRFWALFRALKDDYALCWTDIDKVYYNKEGDYKGTLTYEGEAYLNQKYGDDKKSILEREIDLAKPDCIVFVIGPKYYVSLKQSFGIKDKFQGELTTISQIVDVSKDLNLGIPAFWTYHPANRSKVNVIAAVKEALSPLQKKD